MAEIVAFDDEPVGGAGVDWAAVAMVGFPSGFVGGTVVVWMLVVSVMFVNGLRWEFGGCVGGG